MESLPTVSIIIPTYNRADSLRRTLDSLDKQTYPPDCYEVIVIDDGSTDGTPSIVGADRAFHVQYVGQANQGAAVARNRGMREARGELGIFLDDDITVVPEFVARMTETAKVGRVIVVGNLYPVIRPDATTFERVQAQLATPPPAEADVQEIPFTDCLSGIFAVTRDAFFEIGGMQDVAQDGRVAWGDLDFGYRAHMLGYRIMRCNGATAHHHDFSIRDLRVFSQRWERASRSAALLFRKHPDLLPHIRMFRDKAPICLRRDSPRLVLRKIGRAVTAWRPMLGLIEQAAHLAEQVAPYPRLLRCLYDWTISSYMYRGYRQGLRDQSSVQRQV